MHRTHAATGAHTMSAGLPAAVAGTIALALTAAPAAANAAPPAPVDTRLDDARRTAGGATTRAELRAASAAAQPMTLVAQAAPATATATATLRAAATAVPSTYTVVRGDTVYGIAARFGLRTADVLTLNKLTARSVIYPGQKLTLTGGSGGSTGGGSSSGSAASGTYTVQAGDTVSSIAKKHGATTNAVLSANKLGWSSIIYPGQKLTIPGATSSTGSTATSGSNSSGGASAGASTTSAVGGSYTVTAGDTVSSIAGRHGVGVAAMLTANKLGWSSIIYPGQKLTIPSSTGLNAPQTENALLIIQVGRELGVPDRGIAIALGTAMQESWIRNLDYGDRDSLGLFQQRPSTGWGTAEQVRDRVRSIKAFFGGPSDPNGSRTRGLLDIPGWQNMSFADAAQAVQISAYPERYAQWEKPAYAWLAALG
ncbi:LysM repeat protein [Microbacterium terrae]|uniref:Muramidase-2 n=1 Tax=Microbacterium terrae TaxID=69369 RepID=A0A0M2H4H4_9MICO|nr:LysM peptidoglycan-binding domain-containing protein [Microbacterium terrae]KJL41356.1 Muramidase-2 precursor [Microbacterium terrae]MBP1077605.1 LysM repeat protein [Microbacterium terrae]